MASNGSKKQIEISTPCQNKQEGENCVTLNSHFYSELNWNVLGAKYPNEW